MRSVNEEVYSTKTASQISKLYEELIKPGRRQAIKTVANKYQSRLTQSNIDKLVTSEVYKTTVLADFSLKN